MRSSRAQKALRSQPRKCRSHMIMPESYRNVANRAWCQVIDIAGVRCFDDPQGVVRTFGARVGPSEPGNEPLEAASKKIVALELLEWCIICCP